MCFCVVVPLPPINCMWRLFEKGIPINKKEKTLLGSAILIVLTQIIITMQDVRLKLNSTNSYQVVSFGLT